MNKRFIIAAFVIAVGLPRVPAARLIAPASNREIQTQSEAIESLLRSQQYAKALEAATKLTQTHPDNPLGYNFQGAIYLASQDIAKARASFEKAVSVQSDYEPALMNLAELDLQQKNLSAARTRYEAVLARNANNVFAMLGMAKVEAASKNDTETLAWLRRAKAARPEVAGPRLGLANYYLSKKDYDQTSAELAEWGRLQPNNPEMLIVLARLQTATGKNAEAVSTYQKLVSVRPQSHVAYQTLAVAQMQAGDISGATKLQESAGAEARLRRCTLGIGPLGILGESTRRSPQAGQENPDCRSERCDRLRTGGRCAGGRQALSRRAGGL